MAKLLQHPFFKLNCSWEFYFIDQKLQQREYKKQSKMGSMELSKYNIEGT